MDAICARADLHDVAPLGVLDHAAMGRPKLRVHPLAVQLAESETRVRVCSRVLSGCMNMRASFANADARTQTDLFFWLRKYVSTALRSEMGRC